MTKISQNFKTMENIVKSYLSFRIGTEIFAANVLHIQNIIEYKPLTSLPETPDYFLGVVNVRGEVLPVIDSRIKLGIPASEITLNTCIIVIDLINDDFNMKVGLLVDEVCEVFDVSDSELKPPPTASFLTLKGDVIEGIIPANDKFVILLNLFKITDSDEILRVA